MDLPFDFGKKNDGNLLDINQELEHYKRPAMVKPKTQQEITYEKPMSNIGPAKPSEIIQEDSSSSDDEPDINNPYYSKGQQLDALASNPTSSSIPCSHEVHIKGHKKGVTAIHIDPKGYRMVTGSKDYNLRLWDFLGMNKSMNSFRIIEPYEGQPINKVGFNLDGSQILACAMGSQSKIYDREGRDIAECIKGDMYISDLSNTRGHTAMVRDGQWSPVENNMFISCSLDSTVRIWDTTIKKIGIEQQIPHKTIIKCKAKDGKRTGCTACCYSADGRTIATSCKDGSIQIYCARSYYGRAEYLTLNGHSPNASATSMCFFKDGNRLLTRGADHTLKIWDLKMFKKPLNVWYNLENTELHTEVSLSPDERYIVTGTSITKSTDIGSVLFYDPVTFDKVGQLGISEASVTRCFWHPVLNQIFVGSNDHDVHVLCDPEKSKNGALLCISRKERKVNIEDAIEYAGDIRTPNALPAFKDENKNRKRKQEKLRNDPIKSMKPEIPLQGPGKGGKVAGPGTVTQFIMLAHNKTDQFKEDAREALLRLDEETKQNPDLVGNAYKLTQPVTVFDYTAQPIEEEELLSSVQKICSSCGLKMCRCGKSMRPQNTRSIFSEGHG